MKNKEKMQKYLQRDFELIFVLYTIISIISLIGGINYLIIYFLLIRGGLLVALGFGINAAKKGMKSAGIYGIVISSLMMLTGDIITFLLGLFMIIHSIIYLVNYNKLKQ